MTNVSGGETAKVGHQDVLERYVSFYSRVWSEGGVRVCEDTQLMEQAGQVLVTPGRAAHTFTLLPFYPTLIDIISTTSSTSNASTSNASTSNASTSNASTSNATTVLQRLSKAFEVLELFCINLFLFPWRKEIKTLKKFTGHFVYYIKAILPLQTIRTVLHHIGYDSETDTEYQLSENADPNRAKEMGFELLLARIECEHLINITSQTSDAEALEIIQKQCSAPALQEEPDLDHSPNGVLEEDRASRDDFLLNPELCLKSSDLDMNECQTSRHGSFLSEDKSILEMQKDYPDLAFRQRPIFKSSSTRVRRSGVRDMKSGRETSGPLTITLHPEAPQPSVEPRSSEEQPQLVGAASHTPGLKCGDDTPVSDLADRMDKLKLKEFPGEEPLKCPVEETAQCEKIETIPILCSPSHESVCSITGCGSCFASDRLQQHHGITEPPQSFYIPNRVSGSAPAPPAEHDENNDPCSRADPVLHHTLEL
ncbi:uncharacterized protein si:ch211-189a15.5 [Clarias gariepinus]|uniref:uncharacterized protein si:ch211-189a15.5 n=1 Tax=Clarias gariepinus TaxID=13013 RepID=UPI00234C0E4A|nr:uncharacterized protein si:ch211-189a15.5 [Clarias gariepinus]